MSKATKLSLLSPLLPPHTYLSVLFSYHFLNIYMKNKDYFFVLTSNFNKYAFLKKLNLKTKIEIALDKETLSIYKPILGSF